MTDHSQDAVVARLDNIKFALQRQNMDTFGVPGCRYIGSDEITRLELEALQPGDHLPGGLEVAKWCDWPPPDPEFSAQIFVYRPDAGVFSALHTFAQDGDGNELEDDDPMWFTSCGEDLTDDLPTHYLKVSSP